MLILVNMIRIPYLAGAHLSRVPQIKLPKLKKHYVKRSFAVQLTLLMNCALLSYDHLRMNGMNHLSTTMKSTFPIYQNPTKQKSSLQTNCPTTLFCVINTFFSPSSSQHSFVWQFTSLDKFIL